VLQAVATPAKMTTTTTTTTTRMTTRTREMARMRGKQELGGGIPDPDISCC